MDVSQILSPLNDVQREAVASENPSMLVLAGAGSGKTRVLVHRIAWLIRAKGFSPQSIFAVTFTNKAAREMRNRIEDILAQPTQGMWVGTFHGLAHRLLKQHWREAGLMENFQILDSDDQMRVVKRIIRGLDLDESRWPVKKAQWYINSQKDEGIRATEIEVPIGDLYVKTMTKIYLEYEQACIRSSLVDFAELLLKVVELFRNNLDLLAHYRQRFRQILVDEFQDTNTIQYLWLKVLSGSEVPVVAVGDDDQSIYGWRGAKIQNIQSFSEDFSGTEIVRLEQNYRSTQTILSAANAVIEFNQGRLGKNLWTSGEEGERISLYAGFNEQDEARYIVERVQSWLSQGQNRSSVGILYRSNAQSRVLEDAFISEDIPYRIYGGQRFYERMEIRNALAYLRLISSRSDDAAFERIVNMPPRGIGSKTIEILREISRSNSVSLWQAIELANENNSLAKRGLTSLLGFKGLIDELEIAVDSLPLEDLVKQAINTSGLVSYHEKEPGEKGQARIENLEELISAAREFSPETDSVPPLQQFVDAAALEAGDSQANEYEDSIQLMTLHSAKGLEFPLVILAGMEENLFPHRMSLDEHGRLEEERRLCYVGITRAMSNLIMTYAETRRLHGNDSFNTPSRFIREIPTDLLEEVRVTASGGYYSKFLQTETAGVDFHLGQRVYHQIFGEGVVLNYEGQGDNARVEVNFDSDGSKWLVLQYANLQPI